MQGRGKQRICAHDGDVGNFVSAKIITINANVALTNPPRSTCRSETMKRALTGSSRRKSNLPLRTSSERLVQLIRKNDWKICWMKLLAPMSSTTCQGVHV